MRPWISTLCLAALAGMGLAVESEFTLTAPHSLIVAPVAGAGESLIEAKIEPTRHDLRIDHATTAERWEQNFQLAARLPVAEAFSLRQEFRAGLQNETVLGQELETVFRDALATLEKTSAELQASEALRLAASVQQQWIAHNSVPFAEIVTYGAEVKYSPTKTTTVKLQLELTERDEYAATESGQKMYRLALEQELIPKRLTAAAGGSLGHAEDLTFSDRENFTRKIDGSLKWTPLGATALTLGAEHSERETVAAFEDRAAYALKLQQQLFARSKLELQGGYEVQTRSSLDGPPVAGSAWNLGANSDFALDQDWNAGVGVRYRLREEAISPAPADELSLTLSVKGRF